MKKESYKFDILTRMFSAGAEPQATGGAEIRAPEIRAQLRWWFRILGGFKNNLQTVVEQELHYFGGVGDEPRRSKICVRVRTAPTLKQECKDADELGAGLNTPLGYLLFPLRSNEKKGTDASRAHFLPNDPGTYAFEVSVSMDASDEEWENLKALVAVFGNLGSLGFRSRRCMGAIAFHADAPMSVSDALARFKEPGNIVIKELQSGNGTADGCVNGLANWLKDWRSYGSSRFGLNENGHGFRYAKKDHDAGVGDGNVVYRAAIGLPIIQQYSSGERIKNEWTAEDAERFASPVILRPCRKTDGKCAPLVIFADKYKWEDGRKVNIARSKHEKRTVTGSADLYNAIKGDGRLKDATFLS